MSDATTAANKTMPADTAKLTPPDVLSEAEHILKLSDIALANSSHTVSECIRQLVAEVRRLIDAHERAAATIDQLSAALAASKAEIAQLRGAIKRAGYGVMQTSGDWLICDVSKEAEKERAKTEEIIHRNIELEAALAASEERERWIPVSEGLPKFRSHFIGSFQGRTFEARMDGSTVEGVRSWFDHWRPMPHPPTEAK